MAFEEIYSKLKVQFLNRQARLDAAMNESNDSHERRTQAQEELDALKALDMEEMEAFEERWGQLGAIIDEQKKAAEFISGAVKRRMERQQVTDEGKVDAQSDKLVEDKMLKDLSDLEHAVHQQQTHIQQRQERLTSAEAAFAKLQKFAGEAQVSKLVTQFVNNEDENYSVFAYIQSVNAEIEKEEEQLAKVTKEMNLHQNEQDAANGRKKGQVRRAYYTASAHACGGRRSCRAEPM